MPGIAGKGNVMIARSCVTMIAGSCVTIVARVKEVLQQLLTLEQKGVLAALRGDTAIGEIGRVI